MIFMAKNTTKSLTKGWGAAVKPLTAGKASFKSLPVDAIQKKCVTFSFRFFKQVENFGISGKNDIWMSGLLEQLKVISEKEFDDLVGNPAEKKYFRLHELEFGAGVSALTREDFNFIPVEFRPKGDDCEYWQFQISKANGRVVGFFNEDHTIFYVVFLDPNHNAQLSDYSDYKVRPISPQVSEIDDLRALIAKNVELNGSLEKSSAELLYMNDSVYLCIDREMFTAFDKLMKDGSLQSKFQEFLLEQM